MNIEELNDFIVRAKAATYVGDGEHVPPCRAGSHDLRFSEDGWAYHDSYFGGSDFIGEEVVYLGGRPVWAMNYYGRILGGFEHTNEDLTYLDSSQGTVEFFRGREQIRRGLEIAYELEYHGGLTRD